MSQTIFADIIWKFAPADYQGNNFFIGQVCKKFAEQQIEIDGVTTELPPALKHKISFEVSLQANEIADEDAAVSLIQSKIIAAGLPCEYLILIDVEKSEIHDPQYL